MNDASSKIIMGIASVICICCGAFFLLLCYMKSDMIAPGSKYPEPVPIVPLLLGIVILVIGIIVPLTYKMKKRRK